MSALRILFFGRMSEIAGGRELKAAPPPDVASLSDLRDWIAGVDAALGEALNREGVRVAVNRKLVHDPRCALKGGDEIAFMSPLSGG
jgi:molybdopterin synthase sulfur carrier subunit